MTGNILTLMHSTMLDMAEAKEEIWITC